MGSPEVTLLAFSLSVVLLPLKTRKKISEYNKVRLYSYKALKGIYIDHTFSV